MGWDIDLLRLTFGGSGPSDTDRGAPCTRLTIQIRKPATELIAKHVTFHVEQFRCAQFDPVGLK